MKWILLWAAMGSNGAFTSGSAEFTSADGCRKAQQAFRSLIFDLGSGKTISATTESNCVSAETGDPAPIRPRN